MLSKEQVIRLLDEEISRLDNRSALNALLNFRIDPKPIHILAPDSYKKKDAYEGWCLFETPSQNRCVGYCEEPWDEHGSSLIPVARIGGFGQFQGHDDTGKSV